MGASSHSLSRLVVPDSKADMTHTNNPNAINVVLR